MPLPPGVSVGQGIGIPVEFRTLNGILQHTYSSMKSVASRGASLKPTTTAGEVDLAAATTTLLAGILGQDIYDPDAVPAAIKDNIFADGILTYGQIGQPVSVHKIGKFSLTAVNGTVAYGDFVGPDDNGKWKTYGATNPLKNGAIVCLEGNAAANGPITVMVNLA